MDDKETVCTCGDESLAPKVSEEVYSLPLIGDRAPEFTAETTRGQIHFPDDFSGKWVILFSHPADFTPVCTSEVATFAALADDLKKMDTELIGISVDSVSSHLAWLKSIQDNIRYNDYDGQPITFPLIADVRMDVAKKYGMIQEHASDTKAVRAVFFIDPNAKVRAIIYYPLSNGRNFQEIKRMLTALQTTDKYGVSTPADWEPGDEVLMGAPATMKALREREKEAENNEDCQTWYFCRKKIEE